MFDTEQLQDHYCEQTDKNHRRLNGQFFTPRWIAKGMAQWVLQCRPATIVDPACGMGMLLDECLKQGYEGRLVGIDIDKSLVEFWRSRTQNSSRIEVEVGDFLHKDPGPLQGVVANPPYNRFQNRDIPPYILQKMQELLGEAPSGYTNQYALFLYAVVSQLKQGGRAAFIVPSEFLGTGYGVQVKKFLLKTGRLRHLVLFDTSERIFPDAATTACVLLFGETGVDHLTVWHLLGQADQAAFHAICEGYTPVHARNTGIPYAELDAQTNWQGLGLGEADWSGFIELKAMGRVKRGIATGANEFFLLTEIDARARGFSTGELMPCIANAESVEGVLFTDADWDKLRRNGKPAYLFNGLDACSTSAANYLEHGEREGYHLRYLTKMRRPWYRLESREAAPLLLAVFGRAGFKAVLNHTQSVNLTAFHGFFPDKSHIDLTPLLWMYLQTPLARLAFARQQRAYGDGLKKLEPSDWSKLLVPDWNSWPVDGKSHADTLAEQCLQALFHQDDSAWLGIVDQFQQLIDDHRVAMQEATHQPIFGDQLTLI